MLCATLTFASHARPRFCARCCLPDSLSCLLTSASCTALHVHINALASLCTDQPHMRRKHGKHDRATLGEYPRESHDSLVDTQAWVYYIDCSFRVVKWGRLNALGFAYRSHYKAYSNLDAQYRPGHTHLTMQSSCSAAACSLQKALRLLSISVCCFCSSAQATLIE